MHATPTEPDPDATPPVRRSAGHRSLPARLFGALVQRVRDADLAALLLVGLAGAVAVGGTAMAGWIYEAVLAGTGVARFDQPVLDAMIALRTDQLNAAIAAFSHSGGTFWMTIITGTIVVVMCLVWRRRTPLVLMVIAVGGSLAMTVVGKRLSDRARPPLELSIPPPETSASFPSGHSLNSVAIAGMIAYLLFSRLTTRVARVVTVTVAVLYSAAMGLSRVYLGHHWLTDVLAAWCIGLAWLAVVITCHRLWLSHPGPSRARAQLT